MAQLFARRAADTSSLSRKRSFYTHLAGEDESSPLLDQGLTPDEGYTAGSLEASPMQGVDDERAMEDIASPPDVRVDDTMDRSVPVDDNGPEAVVTGLTAAGDDPEVVVPVYRVGPHLCHLTDGDTRITCKKCGRYVTTYKGTWRNMGTITKQPCKPKARRQKGREGKAPCKQSGGAIPALPPGSRPRGRVPGPSRKLKSHDSWMPIASSSSATQTPE
eukprot:2966428-Amphidinium_carterae.1